MLILIWLGCALAAGAVAAGKGRSFVGWLLLGLLLGPLALLGAAIAGADEGRRERALVQDHKLRQCPRCAELVRSEALACRHCGTDLDPPRWDFWGREIRG